MWIATMLVLTPVVWLHYLTLLIIPFGLIAVAAMHREVTARGWRFAMLSYSAIVLVTPLMATLTFRQDIFDWRTRAVAELGFVALLMAWIATWRFAAGRGSDQTNHHLSDLGVLVFCLIIFSGSMTYGDPRPGHQFIILFDRLA